MKKCFCDQKLGGPSKTVETCKSCKKEWIRYRGGSYDWEYKDCLKCEVEKWVKEIKKSGKKV